MGKLRAEDSVTLRATSVTPVAEISDITVTADVSGSLTDKYFILNSPENSYYVWLRVDGVGDDPEPYAFGERQIIADIATDDAASVIAAVVASAVDAKSEFGATQSASNIVTVTNAAVGAVNQGAEDGTSGFTFAENTAGVDPVEVTVNCFSLETAAAGSVINVISGAPSASSYDVTVGGAYEVVDDNFQDFVAYTPNT